MNTRSNVWEQVKEEIEDYNCICSGMSPPGRSSPDAESQCATRRVPGDKCALVYLTEDCADEGSPVEEGWGTIPLQRDMKPKRLIVRPGCKLVHITGNTLTYDVMNSRPNIWEEIKEEIEDYNCVCSGISPPGRRSPEAE